LKLYFMVIICAKRDLNDAREGVPKKKGGCPKKKVSELVKLRSKKNPNAWSWIYIAWNWT
jgi:hypothetical protein